MTEQLIMSHNLNLHA